MEETKVCINWCFVEVINTQIYEILFKKTQEPVQTLYDKKKEHYCSGEVENKLWVSVQRDR